MKSNLSQQLQEISVLYEQEAGQIRSIEQLTQARDEFLNRKKGRLTMLLRSIKKIENLAERKEIGQAVNAVKRHIESDLEKQAALFSAPVSGLQNFDVTLPFVSPSSGRQHIIRSVQQELTAIFSSMGFSIYEGNEMENERYCFEYLNIPPSHPARDLQDTFYVKPFGADVDAAKQLVMRTHTSNMQVRIMEQFTPPLRVIVPGRAFRNEATDTTHEHTFYQMEGFVVDKDISIANLTYVLKLAMSRILQKEIKIRLRPGYFPYVEPGFEADCYSKETGWVEMLGCGMIHPKVFESAGYPAGAYTGFAFGMGINRLAMMKYGIDDVRWFMSSDLRFIDQFN